MFHDGYLEGIKSKIAIVTYDKNTFIYTLINKKGIKVINVYKKANSLLRILRRVHSKMKLPLINIWLNNELKKLKNFEIIMIFDATLTDSFIKQMKKDLPNKRFIFWYWNPVRSSVKPELLPDDICEKWSYSPKDCEKYHLHHNTTFYFNEICSKDTTIKYDIFFIGTDKGRLDSLLALEKQFAEMKLQTYFHITPTRWFMLKRNSIYKKHLSYDDVLVELGKSKAILDFLCDTNDGLSIRPMESIFFKKKLITNSQLIADYDFYRPQNIFILGLDDLSDLPKFLNSPYEEVDKEIIKKYDFEHWLKRF